MKRQRKQYSADWKVEVALEAIKGQRTGHEIASAACCFSLSADEGDVFKLL